MASALERLKKAANLTPTKRTVTLSDDTVFEFYSAPLTMAERERAQKMPGGDDTNGFALNLLVTKAVDDTGKRLFTAGEIAELKGISIPMRVTGPYLTPLIIMELGNASGGNLAKLIQAKNPPPPTPPVKIKTGKKKPK